MQTVGNQDTIIALATPQGQGAIGVIRISGKDALAILQPLVKTKQITQAPGYTVHLLKLYDQDQLLDEALVSIFKAPKSYTGEDTVEISCHGSPYVIHELLRLLAHQGARLAKPGEFTQRAFLNGKLDLAQAEAVADLIASETQLAHRSALHQVKGAFSKEIQDLRKQLIKFASLIELELDFGEEDVEFADRTQLKQLVTDILNIIHQLAKSFKQGNAIKKGISTVIAGKPNAGKSTLLNALLNEEKAIVSSIAGTTRDFIEDIAIIDGIAFRFIDTAGLRETQDEIEAIGVERAYSKIKTADLVIYLFDLSTTTPQELDTEITKLKDLQTPYLLIGNKIDLLSPNQAQPQTQHPEILHISAHSPQHIATLQQKLLAAAQLDGIHSDTTLITNARHHQALLDTAQSLQSVLQGLSTGITGDFIAMDIRHALASLGEITGEIDIDRDILGTIFSEFCIGK